MIEAEITYKCSECVQHTTGANNCYDDCPGKLAYEAGLIAGYTAKAEASSPDGVVYRYDPTPDEEWRDSHEHYEDPGGDILRCPRCFSQDIKIEAMYIRCLNCGFNQDLYD